MKICCVIPAYNLATKLPQVIEELKHYVDEIIVVDDGSSDETYSKTKDHCLVLRHLINRGQGAALRTGTKFALKRGADIIIHFDGDGQFRAQDLPSLISVLKNRQADMVLGSRFLDHSTTMPIFKKEVIMRLARCFNWLLGIQLSDPQSGFRALTAKAAKQIHWQQDRMAHCTEILYLAHQQKLNIKEVPITVIYTEFGQSLSGGFKIIFDLLLDKLAH